MPGDVLCTRQIQDSIKDSSFSLIKERIRELGLEDKFVMGANYIHCKNGNRFLFDKGLRASTVLSESIKSVYKGVRTIWYEEASDISYHSFDMAFETFRTPGTVQIFTFNRKLDLDPVLDRASNMYKSLFEVVEINYDENPHCPELALKVAAAMKEFDIELYNHHYLNRPKSDTANSLIKMRWVEAAIALYEAEVEGEHIGSLDPADEGEDKHAACYRHGHAVKYVSQWNGGDALAVVEEMAERFEKEDIVDNEAIGNFFYDRVGVGAGINTVLNNNVTLPFKKNHTIIPYNGGSAVIGKKIKDEEGVKHGDKYENLKAQDWDRLAELFKNAYFKFQGRDHGEYITLNPDIPELQALKYEFTQIQTTSSKLGKLMIVKAPKGFKSPNMADSVNQAFSGLRNHGRGDVKEKELKNRRYLYG